MVLLSSFFISVVFFFHQFVILNGRMHLNNFFLSVMNMKDPLTSQPTDRKFDPYVDHGGTVIGLAGKDYCIIAADTRLSDNYVIRSRNISRIFPINDKIALTASGCWADVIGLVNILRSRSQQYQWDCLEEIDCLSLANLLSITLYTRRFFPFFAFCVIGGLDKKGAGVLCKYDALGSMERVVATCSGKGEQLIQPMLDEITKMEESEELWDLHDNSFEDHARFLPLDEEQAIQLVKQSFQSAAEREISIGDGVEIIIIRNHQLADRVKASEFPSIHRLFFQLPNH